MYLYVFFSDLKCLKTNEIKDTTDTIRFASCIDLHLEIDREGQLRAKLYDKIYDFIFLTVKYYFILSNISAAPAY
jgi:hypothetical protein